MDNVTHDQEMRLMADGIIRAVYTDDDGREYVVVDDERVYLD